MATTEIGTRYERHVDTADVHWVIKDGQTRGYFYQDGNRWVLAYGPYFDKTKVFATLHGLQAHCTASTLRTGAGRPNADEVIVGK